jgi:predicted permease
MSALRPGIRRLFRIDRWARDATARDIDDEIALHITLRREQLMRAGMPADEADRESRRLFAFDDGTLQSLHDAGFERNRHMQLRERWDGLAYDARYAARRLVREGWTTAFMLITLALGIGINVSASSVAERVLLRGPQYVREPDRLVRLYRRASIESLGEQTAPWLPYAAFTTLRANLRTLDAIGVYRVDDALVGSGAAAETRRVSMVSGDMFALLGVHPRRGRFLDPGDDRTAVAVVAERYWSTALGRDPNIIGKPIVIEGVPYTVIGIAPSGFTGAEFRRVDVWTPLGATALEHMNMEIVGRMKPGVAATNVARDVERLRPQIEAVLPRWAGWLKGANYLAAPILYDATARRPMESVMASWLAAISALILLASCASVGNLLLARLARRGRELAVRVALGAGRARVARLLALEGLLVAASAALLALLVIPVVEPLIQRALFPDGSWTFSPLDLHLVGAVAILALLISGVVSVAPAIQAGRGHVSETLRGDSSRGAARSPLRSGLTVVQAMLSVVLLVGAGLFIRSLQRVRAVDLGMQPDRVLAIDVHYPRTTKFPGETPDVWFERQSSSERARFRTLVEAARRVPGVETAAIAVGIPFYSGFSTSLWLPGRDSVPALPGGGPFIAAVGSDYFRVMGTALHRGRAFSTGDHEGSEPVVMLSETTARTLWPGGDAVGKCVIISKRDAPCVRVVGVVSDLHRTGLKEEPSLQLYVPIGQESGFSGSWLLVRPRGAATAAWPELRAAIERADPAIRGMDMKLLSQGFDGELRPLHLGMVAFGLSASLALIVAALGLYSVMAHAVAWRRHEIGVRLALGAHPRSIAALIVGHGARLASVGVGLGLLMALAARHWVEPILFNTSGADPIVLVMVVVLLEVLALLAGWLPARRAVAVSPTESLRAE